MDADAFLRLVRSRRGHFLMESGCHSSLWLDLDTLFDDAAAVDPYVVRLTDLIRPYGVEVVCGPAIGGATLARDVARRLDVSCAITTKASSSADGGLFQARYRLEPDLVSSVRGRRVALVDDVMSAGSSLRATYEEIARHGGLPSVIGALLILGSKGDAYFASRHLPVESAARAPFDLWPPDTCPLCAQNVALERVG
jgi:orotate phosphoribosyltransferase